MADRLARQRRIYGCTIQEMKDQFEEAKRLGGPKMLAVSQLSGSIFGALGKLIWLAILGSIAVAVWNYIKSS